MEDIFLETAVYEVVTHHPIKPHTLRILTKLAIGYLKQCLNIWSGLRE